MVTRINNQNNGIGTKEVWVVDNGAREAVSKEDHADWANIVNAHYKGKVLRSSWSINIIKRNHKRSIIDSLTNLRLKCYFWMFFPDEYY